MIYFNFCFKYKIISTGVWKEKPNTILDYSVDIGHLPDKDKKDIQLGGWQVYDLAGTKIGELFGCSVPYSE